MILTGLKTHDCVLGYYLVSLNCWPLLTPQVTSGMAAMSVNDQKGHGTIKAPASIDAEADAGVLRKAMKGIGENS